MQAQWFVEHEVRVGDDAGGWPISVPQGDDASHGSWLSALAQGCALSVLVRAYRLTQEKIFLEVARRAVCTFGRDILDGGVSAPLGEKGIFFEEVAVYPAAHMLGGFLFALFGLYDYVTLTRDAQVEELISRSLATLRLLLDEFDSGFWTYADLLRGQFAMRADCALQVELLEALARYSGDEYYAQVALRWRSYQSRWRSRLRYLVSTCWRAFGGTLQKGLQKVLFPRHPRSHAFQQMRVCISLPIFPVTGGIWTVLEGVAQVTEDIWKCEYVTQYVGSQQSERYSIHRFGTAKMTPWLFPGVWLYVVAGLCKLILLLRHGADYDLILPQDAIFTGAFSALAAKLASVRVVCIDHGDLTLLHNKAYRTERRNDLTRTHWPRPFRFLMQRLLVFSWPSRTLLARISARFIDHFLIPGVAGDGVEEVCQKLSIPTSRVTRYGSMIDLDRHVPYDPASRASVRSQKGIAVDAIVVAIICRLAPEKNLNIALESISRALCALSSNVREHVQVIIAGDGPLRKEVEEDIHRRELDSVCALWGDISAEEVIALLSISDIFLYTSLRGACFAMAILEAMASGCAVVASTRPISNAHLLAEGRGIAVAPGDVEETSEALVRLMNDEELCRSMGRLAREYVATHHSPALFRRTLLRATCWSGLDEL